MQTLTVIIPTYNEAQYLEGALYSVKFANEIIVVDSLSTDDTVKIATDYGCKVVSRKFDNFSNQKNHALQFATSDWILFLDGDERITYALQKELLIAIKSNEHTGYKLNFPHFYMNRFLYHHDNNVTRLVRREKCHFEGTVHEKLIVEGSIGMLKNKVLHYTYKGLLHYISKKDSYAWFQAERLLSKGKVISYFHLGFKPIYRFFHEYILRRGFLDGVPGLAVAAINAYGVFSRYAKMIVLKKGLK